MGLVIATNVSVIRFHEPGSCLAHSERSSSRDLRQRWSKNALRRALYGSKPPSIDSAVRSKRSIGSAALNPLVPAIKQLFSKSKAPQLTSYTISTTLQLK